MRTELQNIQGDHIRWALGTIDVGGFTRTTPALGAVMTDGLGVTRVEAGNHDFALGFELGMRARSWLEDVVRPCPACGGSIDECYPIDRAAALEGFCS